MSTNLSLRTTVGACLGALALGLFALALLSSPSVGDETTPKVDPPDLVQVPPYRISIARAVVNRRTRWRVAFASAVENAHGRGSIIIVGHRPNLRTQYLAADQYVDVIDPNTNEVLSQNVIRNVGRMHYAFSSTHEHFHLLGFEHYELRRPSDNRRVARDQKTGYCLGDRFQIGTLPGERSGTQARASVHARSSAVASAGIVKPTDLDEECGSAKPKLLQVKEGITQGNGDDYKPNLEGQYLDVTNLASGRYLLVHRVNTERKLLETDYTNDVASALVQLTRHGTGRPTVKLINRCGSTARCTAA